MPNYGAPTDFIAGHGNVVSSCVHNYGAPSNVIAGESVANSSIPNTCTTTNSSGKQFHRDISGAPVTVIAEHAGENVASSCILNSCTSTNSSDKQFHSHTSGAQVTVITQHAGGNVTSSCVPNSSESTSITCKQFGLPAAAGICGHARGNVSTSCVQNNCERTTTTTKQCPSHTYHHPHPVFPKHVGTNVSSSSIQNACKDTTNTSKQFPRHTYHSHVPVYNRHAGRNVRSTTAKHFFRNSHGVPPPVVGRHAAGNPPPIKFINKMCRMTSFSHSVNQTRPSTQTSELAGNLPRTNVPRYAASCSGSRYQPSRTYRNVKSMRNSKKSSQQSNTGNYCEYNKEISNKEPRDSGFNTSTESESVTLQKSQEGKGDCYITAVNLNEHNDNDCKMARNDSQMKVHEEKPSFPQRSINFDVAKEL